MAELENAKEAADAWARFVASDRYGDDAEFKFFLHIIEAKYSTPNTAPPCIG